MFTCVCGRVRVRVVLFVWLVGGLFILVCSFVRPFVCALVHFCLITVHDYLVYVHFLVLPEANLESRDGCSTTHTRRLQRRRTHDNAVCAGSSAGRSRDAATCSINSVLAAFLRNLAVTFRGPTDHINIRILHSSGKAQYKGHSRNHGL